MPSVAQIEAILADVAPEMVAQALTERSTLYRMIEKTPPSDAKGPRWQVEVSANASVGSFAIGGALGAPGELDYDQAALGWANYAGTFEIADRLTKQINTGSSELLVANYIDQQMEHIAREMVSVIEADLFAGTGPNTVVGLSEAIADANVYAGIDRAAVAAWRSYVNDNGGVPRAITAALLDDVHDELTSVREGRYDVVLTSSDQWNAIAGLATGTGVITNQSGAVDSKFLGFSSLFYKGRPVIAIPGFTAGVAYFVDMSQLRIEQLPGDRGTPFAMLPAERTNADFTVAMVSYMQLKLMNPRRGAAALVDLS